MNLVVIALINALALLILAVVTGWQRRRDKQQDYDREDEREAAAIARQDEVAAKLVADNAKVARIAQQTSGKLDVIHTLVNSNMTAAMQAELDATVRELAMMKEVIALNSAAGREPSEQAEAAIQATQGKIDELSAALRDRLKQTQVAEQQQQQQQGGA